MYYDVVRYDGGFFDGKIVMEVPSRDVQTVLEMARRKLPNVNFAIGYVFFEDNPAVGTELLAHCPFDDR